MRIIAALAVALVACCILGVVVGPAMGHHVFSLPFLGWSMSWSIIAFTVVGVLTYRAVKA